MPSSLPPSHFEYYVHYEGYDRRNDEWRQFDELDLSNVEIKVPEAVDNSNK